MKVWNQEIDSILKEIKSFEEATEQHQKWLSQSLILVDSELEKLQKTLAKSTPFEFLRATFYRWSQWWLALASLQDKDQVSHAPIVLGVADLHIENFGTWRDSEGRLVWGVNDVDECAYLPYTQDLIRLATSAYFGLEEYLITQKTIEQLGLEETLLLKAYRKKSSYKDKTDEELKKIIEQDKLKPLSHLSGKIVDKILQTKFQELRENTQLQAEVEEAFKKACNSLLKGYSKAWENPTHQQPFILANDNDWLREVFMRKITEDTQENSNDPKDDFDKFFQEMQELETIDSFMPQAAWEALRQSMPYSHLSFRIGKREAGFGSLGRQRFTAVVDQWQGGILVREAKALAPSSWYWAQTTLNQLNKVPNSILVSNILHNSVRSPDPWLRVYQTTQETWLVSRLMPDSGKVKLKDIPTDRIDLIDQLWEAMGCETANMQIPCGDIRQDLLKRNEKDANWLYESAKDWVKVILADWITVYRPS